MSFVPREASWSAARNAARKAGLSYIVLTGISRIVPTPALWRFAVAIGQKDSEMRLRRPAKQPKQQPALQIAGILLLVRAVG
jgi:hypothetical protein